MRRLRAWLVRLAGTLRKSRLERELADEIDNHLRLHIEDNLRSGMTPEEARRRAILEFGPVEAIKESYRDRRGLPLWDAVVRDLRAALRMLLRRPAFSLVVVSTLALGIGANAAIFSVVDAILLRPLPYPEAHRVVEIRGWSPQAFTTFGRSQFRVSPPEIASSRAFHAIALTMTGGINLSGSPAERARVAAVTEQFFDVLGIDAAAGRTFDADDVAESRQLTVLSHRLWQRRFAGDATIIGRSIRLNERPYVVVGVMPPRIDYPDATEIWIPNGADFQIGGRAHATTLVARLADGVSAARAREEVNRLDRGARPGGIAVRPRGLGGNDSGPRDPVQEIVELRRALVGDFRSTFLLIASGALLVLLVASLNAANLLLTRVAARSRELAVRRALGASRLQVGRQLFVESVVLSGVAAIASLPAAFWVLGIVRALVPIQLYGAREIALDGRAFLGLAVISLLAATISGLAPVLSVRGRRSAAILRGGFQATHETFWQRCRGGVAVAEIAVAVILLVGALTMVRVVREALAVDMGARGENALTLQLTLPNESYGSREELVLFFERLSAALDAVPAIEAFGATDQLPGDPHTPLVVDPIEVVGRPWDAPDDDRWALELSATPGYFEAIGIDLIVGRTFTRDDRAETPRVAVVSEGFARALGVEPADLLGEQVNLSSFGRGRLAEIVGVVRDVRIHGPDGDFRTAIYKPFLQGASEWEMRRVVVRGASAPQLLAGDIRRAVTAIAPDLPLHDFRTFEEVIAVHLEERHLAMATMLAFSGLASLLAIAGLYAVIAYLVRLRRREIGIRMALGAAPSRVRREVLVGGIGLALAGTALGVAATLAIWRAVTAAVPGLGSVDPRSLVLVACSIPIISAAATWLPAARATRFDPVEILRSE